MFRKLPLFGYSIRLLKQFFLPENVFHCELWTLHEGALWGVTHCLGISVAQNVLIFAFWKNSDILDVGII